MLDAETTEVPVRSASERAETFSQRVPRHSRVPTRTMQTDADAAWPRLDARPSSPRHAKRDSLDDVDLLASGDDRSDIDADDGHDVDRNGKRKRPVSVS